MPVHAVEVLHGHAAGAADQVVLARQHHHPVAHDPHGQVQEVAAGGGANLLILDEPTDGFSKEQLSKVRDVLTELKCPQVILVSHERELEAFADRVYRVERVDGISRVSSQNNR